MQGRIEYVVAYNPDDDHVYYKLAFDGEPQSSGKVDWWAAWNMFMHTYDVMTAAVSCRTDMHRRDTVNAIISAQAILEEHDTSTDGISPWVRL